jgi:hypothetical protein
MAGLQKLCNDMLAGEISTHYLPLLLLSPLDARRCRKYGLFGSWLMEREWYRLDKCKSFPFDTSQTGWHRGNTPDQGEGIKCDSTYLPGTCDLNSKEEYNTGDKFHPPKCDQLQWVGEKVKLSPHGAKCWLGDVRQAFWD